MKNLETETRINRWWRLRLDQKIEECRLELAELKHGFESGPGRKGEAEAKMGAELKLMEAALWRAEGQVGRAQEQIESVGEDFREAGISPSFQYYLQRGLHRLLASDYTGALEHFLAARNTAPGGVERVWALANSLFCLEYLGLPFSRTREELAREMVGIELPEGIRDQIEAFDLRAAFRGGRFEAFAALSPTQGSSPGERQTERQSERQSERMTQAFYYRLWISELPFWGGPRISEDARERFFSSDPWFHLRSYRARTLQGMVHPDDLASFKPTELADRLYLWTWRWMAGPKEFRFDRLAPLLPSLEPKKLGYRLSAEDFQMIRNSLLWLALWDGCPAGELRDILSFLRPGQIGDYPIFDFERAMIGYFECLRDRRGGEAEQRLAYLRAHPLWSARFNEWRPLVEAVAGGKTPALHGHLASFAAHLSGWIDRAGPAPPRASRLSLDLVTFEIRKGSAGAKALISPPICRAYEILRERRTVTTAEFALVCFGIHRFDPVVHDSKVFNLLARMRALAPRGLALGVKSGSVFAEGSEETWAKISFSRRHPLASGLRDSDEWRAFLARPPAGQKPAATDDRFVKPSLILRRLAGRDDISRLELEKLIGKSRATSHRLIARWLRQGYLKKKGKARNTRYAIVALRKGSV